MNFEGAETQRVLFKAGVFIVVSSEKSLTEKRFNLLLKFLHFAEYKNTLDFGTLRIYSASKMVYSLKTRNYPLHKQSRMHVLSNNS